MPTLHEVQSWNDATVFGSDDDKIGDIKDVYLDRHTGEPAWLAVKTGLFGMKVSFVPIAQASRHDEHVHVPFSKSQVKDAPNVDADGELTPEEERRLYEHYNVEFGDFDYDAAGEGEAGRPRLRRHVVDPVTEREPERRI